MSGFKDTFTKDDGKDSLLGYDDTAFYYFASSIVFVIVVPYTYSVIKNALWGKTSKLFPAHTADGKEFVYCKTKAMEEKREEALKEAKKHTSNDTVKFIAKLVLIAAIWAGLFYLTQYCASQKQIKSFDPFEILQVAPEAETGEIKKAYRKLSLVYHPDKNQGDPIAQTKFIEITKAYEALTDDTARKNYEMYGNPDGPDTSSKVGIGLPSFLLEKDNHVLILSAFFFLLLIFVPTVGICYYQRIKDYTASGVMVETYEWCQGVYLPLDRSLKNFRDTGLITDNKKLKDMPEIYAQSAECRMMPLKVDREYEKVYKQLEREVDWKQKGYPLPPMLHEAGHGHKINKNVVLLLAHMDRLHAEMVPLMREELDTMLRASMKITQEMMEIVKWKSIYSWSNTPYSLMSTKYLDTAQAIISFRRCIVQCLKSGDRDDELLQIPHFTEEVLKHCKKGKQSKQISKLSDWLSRAPEERKGIRDMDQQKTDDMELFCEHYSKSIVQMHTKIEVEGEDDGYICMGDTATITIGLTRTNLEEHQAVGPVHAPLFPERKFEEWWLFLTAVGSPKIIAMERIRSPNRHVEARMQVPIQEPFVPKNGNHKLEVHALNDSYLGLDQKVNLEFTVHSSEDAQREEFIHKEDAELELYPTLFQQIAGLQTEQDSDEEEEDENDEKKEPEKSKKKTKKKSKEDDEESSSSSGSSDDEKEEKEEKEEDNEDKDQEADDEKPVDEAKVDEVKEVKKASAKKPSKAKAKKDSKNDDESKEKAKKDSKKDDESSDASSSDDSDSDNEKASPKKSGPCSACVLS